MTKANQPGRSNPDSVALNTVQNAPGWLRTRPDGQEPTPAPPDPPPVILGNNNETGITLDRLFPRLDAANVEFWRQQAAAEEVLADELYRRFLEDTQGRRL